MLILRNAMHPRLSGPISVSLEAGRLIGLTGPNGAGKTTLLKLAAGLLPCPGAVWLQGRPLEIWSLADRRDQMSYLEAVPEAAWNISVARLLDILSPGCPEVWIHRMEIGAFLTRSILNLSAGERQRVFLAATLARPSRVLLLDEPLKHLDPAFQRKTMDLLKQEAHTEGKAVLVVLHEPNLATTYCDEIWKMEQGVPFTPCVFQKAGLMRHNVR